MSCGMGVMIIYHPGYDVHHCSYRILNVLSAVDGGMLPHDTLKLIDFYYVYPHLLKNITQLPRPLNYQKRKIENIKNPFEITPNPKSLFYELSSIQESALDSLSQKLLISSGTQKIEINKSSLPNRLIEMFKMDEFCNSDVFEILVNRLPKAKLNGENGLKARSGLMEYRYG